MNRDDEGRSIPKSPHRVVIDNGERIVITAVEDVDSFNENEVICLTSCGFMTITGEDLHIQRLNLEEGQLNIEGRIQAIDYSDHEAERAKGSVLSRMFK